MGMYINWDIWEKGGTLNSISIANNNRERVDRNGAKLEVMGKTWLDNVMGTTRVY